jgi:hypothetical protein
MAAELLDVVDDHDALVAAARGGLGLDDEALGETRVAAVQERDASRETPGAACRWPPRARVAPASAASMASRSPCRPGSSAQARSTKEARRCGGRSSAASNSSISLRSLWRSMNPAPAVASCTGRKGGGACAGRIHGRPGRVHDTALRSIALHCTGSWRGLYGYSAAALDTHGAAASCGHAGAAPRWVSECEFTIAAGCGLYFVRMPPCQCQMWRLGLAWR